jgi:type I restriction enzyme S subunit
MTFMTTGWKVHRLDELGFVGRGRSRHRPRNDPSLYGGSYPFVQTADIKGANLRLRGFTQTYNETGLAQSKMWAPGTLCITIAANIAETAILAISVCFPDSVIGFIADPEKSDAFFIKYYIDFIKLRMQQVSHGTTQDNLSLDKLLRFDFVVPKAPVQQKIASILSAYDDLIENNLRRIKILEEMAQSLYREWFVKFRFPGHQKVKMVDSPLGKMPEGWEAKRLGDIAEDMRRGVIPSEVPPDTPYIGLEHLPRKSIALSQWGFADDVQSTKFKFKRGEILFGKIRPYFHKVGFAPIDGICSSDTIVIADKDHKWYPLLLCCVSSEDFVAHATQTSKGTKMPRADWEVLKKYPIPVPPPSLLTKFNSILENNLGLIESLIFRNHNLRQTRDLLLPKLISGELDVSELDITIPEAKA